MKHSNLERPFASRVVWGVSAERRGVFDSRALAARPKPATRIGGEFDWGGTFAKK